MNITHRHGGRITAVHAIGHETYKGVASWFFVADVAWDDGSRSEATEVSPNCFGGDDAVPYLRKLSDYLASHGEWHEPKHKRDGRTYSWTPHKNAGREELTEAVS